jgi:hypothetical protein
MCGPALPIIMAVAAVAGAGASIYGAVKSNANQKAAISQSEAQAATTAAANERAINQANSKQPNMTGIYQSNLAANSNGVGSTMLTGMSGQQVSPSLLSRSTLLGS